jgi:phytoene dehydrogenase-like protein
MARFGLPALQPARGLAHRLFREDPARALFAGLGAHSIMSLRRVSTAAFGLMLGLIAHAVGWPILSGGSQRMADALAAYLRTLGGEVETSAPVASLDELPSARAILMDVTPAQLLRVAGDKLPPGYRRRLSHYRYGPGVFKIDLALDGPIPWQAEECLRAATVHVGGSLEEIVESEGTTWRGGSPDRPFVILVQPTLFDPTRAPEGKHTVWAYCHVPNGSTVDMTERIERQIERFAPGFRDRIIGRSAKAPADMEAYNSNYVGGDINGGVQDVFQLFTRPVLRLVPYSTPVEGLYLCSSSTPPGGGVHGMCGYYAARAALRDVRW